MDKIARSELNSSSTKLPYTPPMLTKIINQNQYINNINGNKACGVVESFNPCSCRSIGPS